MSHKICSACKVAKDFLRYRKHSTKCRDCANLEGKERRKLLSLKSDIKTCTECSFKGDKALFANNRMICNICYKKRQKRRRDERKKNAPPKVKKKRTYIRMSDAEHNKKKLDYRIKNREKINAKNRVNYGLSEEEISVKQKHKEDISKEKYEKRKFREGFSNLFREYMRGRITKSKTFEAYMPYTVEDLRFHLESQFDKSWMTWENRGKYIKSEWDDDDKSTWKWQVDHIIPDADFNYMSEKDDDFKLCWSLENLRPLSAKQNHSDGVTRIRHKKKENK